MHYRYTILRSYWYELNAVVVQDCRRYRVRDIAMFPPSGLHLRKNFTVFTSPRIQSRGCVFSFLAFATSFPSKPQNVLSFPVFPSPSLVCTRKHNHFRIVQLFSRWTCIPSTPTIHFSLQLRCWAPWVRPTPFLLLNAPQVLIWEYNIPVPIKYISEPEMHSMPATTLHPSGGFFVGQSLDNKIVTWTARDKFRQMRKKEFKGHVNAGYACRMSFSPNGKFLASGDGQGKMYIWDWGSTKVYRRLQVRTSNVWHVGTTCPLLRIQPQHPKHAWRLLVLWRAVCTDARQNSIRFHLLVFSGISSRS